MANPLLAAMQRGSMDNMISDKLGPLKPALSHIGLYMGIVVFTAAGAKVSVHTLFCLLLELFPTIEFEETNFRLISISFEENL